jgi:hypothetical protein
MKVRGYGGHSILKSVLDGNVNSHLHATGHIQGDATLINVSHLFVLVERRPLTGLGILKCIIEWSATTSKATRFSIKQINPAHHPHPLRLHDTHVLHQPLRRWRDLIAALTLLVSNQIPF